MVLAHSTNNPIEWTDKQRNIVIKIGPATYPIFENAHGKAKLPAPIMAFANETLASQSEMGSDDDDDEDDEIIDGVIGADGEEDEDFIGSLDDII